MSALRQPVALNALREPISIKSLRELQVEKQLSRDLLKLSIPELEKVLEGLPKGAITEIFGPPSSGKSTLLHGALAAAVRAGEFCTLIDANDAFDPVSAEASGVDLTRLLWVRCGGSLENAIRAADMLVHGGGWGLIALDLGDLTPAALSRLPISYWYRFRLAVQNTPTVMLVLEREPFVRSCAALAIEMTQARPKWTGTHPRFQLLDSGNLEVAPKKPVGKGGRFEAKPRISA
jgi:RecA/RadA recombinase